MTVRYIPPVGGEDGVDYKTLVKGRWPEFVIPLFTILLTWSGGGLIGLLFPYLIGFFFARWALNGKRFFVWVGLLLWLIHPLSVRHFLAAALWVVSLSLIRWWRTEDEREPQPASPELSAHLIFGVAGSGIGSAEATFGERAKIGEKGEVACGALLNEFASAHPHVRVFHGLTFNPLGTTDADVDHAVLIGRQLILIDAKNWKPGSYRFATSNTVWRDGEGTAWSGSLVHMDEALSCWMRYLLLNYNREKPTVTAVVALSGDGPYTIGESTPYNPVLLMDLNGLRDLLEKAATTPQPVRRRLIQAVYQKMKNPSAN